MDIVFLHGGRQNGSIWGETIAALALQEPGVHRCIVLDAPGCGARRGLDTSAMTHEALIDTLVADVRAAGASRAMLVGHSQAGTALPAMVARAPELFAKVVYVSCVAPVPGGDMMQTVMAIHAAPEAPLHGIFGNPDVPPLEQFRAMFCNDMGPEQAEAFLARLVDEGYPHFVVGLEWVGVRPPGRGPVDLRAVPEGPDPDPRGAGGLCRALPLRQGCAYRCRAPGPEYPAARAGRSPAAGSESSPVTAPVTSQMIAPRGGRIPA